MEGGGAVTPTTTNDNIITEKQSFTRTEDLIFLPFQTAVFATTFGLLGAAGGALFRGIANCFAIPLETRLISPRSFAVLEGVNEGMICAMKGIREKDDTQARAVAGFTSGFMFYMVGNKPSPRRVPDAIGIGLLFALSRGHAYWLNERSALEDTHYTRTRCMLSELGLEDYYKKHFKKHLLRDETMHLLKESDLEKAGIPLGARKLILSHIERDPDLRIRGEAENTHVRNRWL